MILKYWADEPFRSAPCGTQLDYPPDWDRWRNEGREAQGIDDIKPLLRDGYPLYVNNGLTPLGHTWGSPALPVTGPYPSSRLGPRSGVLGVIAPYEMFEETNLASLTEVVTASCRVVIGYDDERQLVVLHDPSFGPAWKVPFEAFEKMWCPLNRRYLVIHPPNPTSRPAKHPDPWPYRPRSAGELAAALYATGYAYSCAQMRKEAKDCFDEGLKLPDLSPGYRHLFLLELAVQAMTDADYTLAADLLNEATSLVPQHSLPWRMLLQVQKASPSTSTVLSRLSVQYHAWRTSHPSARQNSKAALPADLLLWPGGLEYLAFDVEAEGQVRA